MNVKNKSTTRNSIIGLGLMSGTSMDGLDMAICEFTRHNEEWDHKLLETSFVPFDNKWSDKLKRATSITSSQLLNLHTEYGCWLGAGASEFIKKAKHNVDFIASHGYTVFHQPHNGFTFQIGAGQEIANITHKTTIADFRAKDVSLGGQGAPLVPIGDLLLFNQYDACLNLGGFANISFDLEGIRRSFDVAPANIVLNFLANKVGAPYDKGGQLARQGKEITELLNTLNGIKFYRQPFPKSLGTEWLHQEFLPNIQIEEDPRDLLHTCTIHIAYQLSVVINGMLSGPSKVLVTGGGAYNDFLIQCLQQLLSKDISLVIPSSEIIDFKEAIIFAFLGALRLNNEINTLASVTGASKDSSGGIIYTP